MVEQTRAAAAAGQLQTIADQILADVRRLAPELINWIPAEGAWSVMDILCHIREFVPFWTEETVRIARQPEELWGRDHTDSARLVGRRQHRCLPGGDVLADIRQAVQRSADRLGGLRDTDLAVEAVSRNPRWGTKPASFVLEHLLVQHLEKHLGQIRRNVAQFAERQRS